MPDRSAVMLLIGLFYLIGLLIGLSLFPYREVWKISR